MPHPKRGLKVVCISDTHGADVSLPDGDLLLHAGDLTGNGTFKQIQAALDWLSRQPHEHKVIIAGNHDGLLDKQFVASHPDQYPGETRGEADFNWGSLTYLKDSSVTLGFHNGRSLKVFGSPWTCRTRGFGVGIDDDIWNGKIPNGTDILLSHGPPFGHLDSTELGNRGSKSLLKELNRAQPKLVVYGHIHEGYGQELLRLEDSDSTRREKLKGPGMLESLFDMLSTSKPCKVHKKKPSARRTTLLVNAAVPKPSSKEAREGQIRNKPIVVMM
jgi:predicted phosphodiesterase